MDSLKGKVLTGISITRCYKICDKYSVAVYVTIITDTAVLGPRQPSELGVTLTHEHLLLDYTVGITQPRYCSAEQDGDEEPWKDTTVPVCHGIFNKTL